MQQNSKYLCQQHTGTILSNATEWTLFKNLFFNIVKSFLLELTSINGRHVDRMLPPALKSQCLKARLSFWNYISSYIRASTLSHAF